MASRWYRADVSVCLWDDFGDLSEEQVREQIEQALSRSFGSTGGVVRDVDEETD